MPCRLGDESATLRSASVEPAQSEALALSIAFGDEPHTLCLARSPRFSDLDRIWDVRADMPEAILLALAERAYGPLFQMLENAVRKQLRLVGLAEPPRPDARALVMQVADVVFTLTRSETVVRALGVLRNLDMAHESIRSLPLAAQVEYAAFALPEADLASLAPGDALLVPEIATIQPRLVVDGRFLLGENGVAPHEGDARVHVCAAEARPVSLGEVFDAVGTPPQLPAALQGAQLRLVRNGRDVAAGRLGRVGDQNAFVVEATNH